MILARQAPVGLLKLFRLRVALDAENLVVVFFGSHCESEQLAVSSEQTRVNETAYCLPLTAHFRLTYSRRRLRIQRRSHYRRHRPAQPVRLQLRPRKLDH